MPYHTPDPYLDALNHRMGVARFPMSMCTSHGTSNKPISVGSNP